jgi:hypothetical protein
VSGKFLFRAGLCGLATLTCGASACGSAQPGDTDDQHYLNTSRVERAIEQSVLSQRDRHAHVYCPTEVPQVKGQRFTCLAYSASEVPTLFTAVQVDAQGDVQYSAK